MIDFEDHVRQRMREETEDVHAPSWLLGAAHAGGVRRRRRHRAGLAAVPPVMALAVAAVLVPSVGPFSSPDDRDHQTAASAAPSATNRPPAATGPLLPEPWRMDSTQSTSLQEAATAGDAFCGVTELAGPLPAVRQSLSDGARTVRVYAVATPSFERASELFKMLHSQCGAGDVSSEEGPALYWQQPGAPPSAALWDDTTVYLVTGNQLTAGNARPDLRPLVADLSGVVKQPCHDSMKGKACPPG